MLFTIFQESRRGSRKMNQDRVAHSYSRESLIMVAADGMGGHAGGEIAAQITVRILIERFQNEAKPILKNPLLFLHDTMMRAHAALGHYAEQFSLIETPRTTCVGCVIQEDKAHWAHVGDSRLYMFRRAQLIAQTKDHSKVQYLLDQGAITPLALPIVLDRPVVLAFLEGRQQPVRLGRSIGFAPAGQSLAPLESLGHFASHPLNCLSPDCRQLIHEVAVEPVLVFDRVAADVWPLGLSGRLRQ